MRCDMHTLENGLCSFPFLPLLLFFSLLFVLLSHFTFISSASVHEYFGHTTKAAINTIFHSYNYEHFLALNANCEKFSKGKKKLNDSKHAEHNIVEREWEEKKKEF